LTVWQHKSPQLSLEVYYYFSNIERSDKVIADIKWCRFFAS